MNKDTNILANQLFTITAIFINLTSSPVRLDWTRLLKLSGSNFIFIISYFSNISHDATCGKLKLWSIVLYGLMSHSYHIISYHII